MIRWKNQEINFSTTIYLFMNDKYDLFPALINKMTAKNPNKNPLDESIFAETKNFFQVGVKMAPNLVGSATVQKLIHSDEKFDAVMMESYFIQQYQSAFLHKFNAIGIETISFGE